MGFEKQGGKDVLTGESHKIHRAYTGIRGLDDMLEGGLPRERAVVLCGSAGTGKTVFLNEFIYRGITAFQENGVFVTLEERPKDIVRNVQGFRWDYDLLVEEGKLAFVDASPDQTTEINDLYNLSPLVERIQHGIDRVNAKRVAIDGVGALFARFSNKEAVRDAVYAICDAMKQAGVTAAIAVEALNGPGAPAAYRVSEYVADGVIELTLEAGEQQFTRSVLIRKMRGIAYRSGKAVFEISPEGIEVFPKLSLNFRFAPTDFAKRMSTGIKRVDEAMGGGVPTGHLVLVSGNTGTGKTLFGMQFIQDGITRGEKAVFVSMEEPWEQVCKTANQFGFDFRRHEKERRLFCIRRSLIDLHPDRLLQDIRDILDGVEVERVLFDSLSSLLTETIHIEKARQFLFQLSRLLKSQGITCLMTYLAAPNFGAGKEQLLGTFQLTDMRLSSVADGIVMLRYVERERRVCRLLNVLKMRGSDHSKDIFHYDVSRDGIRLGEKFIN